MGSSSGENSRSRTGAASASVLLLVVLLVVTLGLNLNSVAAQRVNCRKFVYAPICRGTASKRAFPPSSDESDSYTLPERKLETGYNDYPAGGAIQENENKVGGSFREIVQRQRQRQRQRERRLYRQMDQPKAEPFDATIYDY